MKRSQALEIIDTEYSKFVEDWINTDLDNLDLFVPLPERILSALEKVGMLPPFSDRMWEETANTYLEPQPYRWEPEDE